MDCFSFAIAKYQVKYKKAYADQSRLRVNDKLLEALISTALCYIHVIDKRIGKKL